MSTIAKTDNYEQDLERNFYTGKEFVPINLAYAWNAEIIKPFESSKGNYTTEKGVETTRPFSRVIIFVFYYNSLIYSK